MPEKLTPVVQWSDDYCYNMTMNATCFGITSRAPSPLLPTLLPLLPLLLLSLSQMTAQPKMQSKHVTASACNTSSHGRMKRLPLRLSLPSTTPRRVTARWSRSIDAMHPNAFRHELSDSFYCSVTLDGSDASLLACLLSICQFTFSSVEFFCLVV